MRITVIGTGYLGAVHAACMADIGHDVLGVDVDAAKIAALAEGRPPFHEPGLPDLLARTRERGTLRFTTSLQEAAGFGDVHFVCVGTPQRKGSYAADMSYVDAVVEGLVRHVDRPCLVVGKSTVPVGTADRLSQQLTVVAPQAEIAWNPEFLREGTAVVDTLEPDRIVIGVRSPAAEQTLRDVYSPMLDAGTPMVVTDLATAELVKVSANSFLATKISFINAISEVCEATGADVVHLARAIGMDSRIGPKFLAAGLGFGGGCLPKDIRAFYARGQELNVGESLAFLREVDEINMRRRRRTVDVARDLVGGSFLGRKVAVLGAAFKPDSDDIRDSPALNVAAAIQLQGGHVCVHDEEAIDNARIAFPSLDYALEPAKACEGADVVLHLTEWRQYRDLDPAALAAVTSTPRVLDARNALDLPRWQAAGWTVRAWAGPLRDDASRGAVNAEVVMAYQDRRRVGTILLTVAGVAVAARTDLRHSANAWCGPVPAAARTTAGTAAKKGIGTWYFDGAGLALANAGLSWFYTWQSGTAGLDPPTGARFVPMIWGADMVTGKNLSAARQGGDTVLGFNEPDVGSQSNLDVEQALSLWPHLTALGARLGSPAVSANAATPGGWLDRFLSGAAARSQRVDFVALHWYGADFTDPHAAAEDLCRYLAATYDRYGKPLWLTEYALADFTRGVTDAVYPTEDQQAAFAAASVPMLESLPFLERYAWFALSDIDSPFRTGLYSDATTLTPVGRSYLRR